jgi:succinate dehydrogenase/fumarate reductase-like Fe-S protein
VLSGYRGFLHELARTGTWRALALQVRTGGAHVVRRLLRRGEPDPIARFLANYGADGFRLPDPARARLQLAAEACLACGLCTVECARAGGAPALDPRDAVLSAARLEIDWIRLGLPSAVPGDRDASAAARGACAACAACEPVCPVAIPIAAVQETLVHLGAAGVATPGGIR